MERTGAKRGKTGTLGRSLPRLPGAMPRSLQNSSRQIVKRTEREETGKSLIPVVKR